MTRARACMQWIGCLALLFCCVHSGQAEEIRDYYSEPGLNPFKDALNQSLNEHIDPFSGTLQLKYTDITVPGNGGMDININRVYVSVQETSLPLLGINGVGWTMHFGRIVTPQRNADKLCSQGLFAASTVDNPSLELPDGGRELLVLNSINNDGSLITRSNWKAQCVAGQSGMLVTSPDGTRYTMSHATFLQGEPSWMTTRIEDVHGNWIRIDYQTNAAGISYITQIYRSEEGTAQPVVTYEYVDQNDAGIKLSAISANGQRWQYFYQPIPGYMYDHYQQLVAVQRPDGRRWQYAYNPAPQDPDPNDGVIEFAPGGYSLRQMVYPHGTTVDYTYQYVQFDPGSSLRTTAVLSKSVAGSAVASGQWQFAFAPHSRAYTSEGHTLRYDVTTVTGPDAVHRYVHYGKDYAGLPDGGQVYIRPSFVGLLAFKETYSLNNVLLEKRQYTWTLRLVSTENFWHGAGYRDWWIEDNTYAPMPLGEGYSQDAGVSNTGYLHIKLYFNHDAYGNPGGIYEKSNIAAQLSHQTMFTYRNDTSRWILGLPLTETYQTVQSDADPSPTTVGQVTRTYYDHGKVQTENSFGVVTEYTYTSAGDLASVEDARGFTREYSNYRRGIARREELPESVVLLRAVNATGTLQSETNGRGFTTSYTYDDLNRLTGIDYPINADVTIAYDAQGGASRRALTRNQYRQIELINDFGQTIRTERHDQQSAQSIYKTMSFDALGRQTFMSYPNDTIGITTVYDSLGRVSRTQHPDLQSVNYTYDDQTVVVLNERNYRSEYIYLIVGVDDSKQEPYRIVQNFDVATIIERDAFSNTTKVLQGTLSGGTVTGYAKTYRYDSRQFMTEATEHESGTTVYTHDALGNVLTESANAEPATTFTWDGLGRRVAVNFADATPDVATVHDRNGNVIELSKGLARWNYVYDDNDNLHIETLSVHDRWFGPRSYQLTYAHDSMDVVSSATYPSGLVVQYAPDAFGRATRVGTFASNVTYHPSGQLSSYTLGNGVTTTVALDQRLLTRRVQSSGVLDLTYAYDVSGNVYSITDAVTPSDSVLNMGYDGLDRLTAAAGSWGQRYFSYDSNGNFVNKVIGSETLRHSLDGRARLAQVERGASSSSSSLFNTMQFDYDVRGNIASKRSYHMYSGQGMHGFIRSVATRLRFDAASNLLSAEVRDSNQPNVARRAYAYDGNGMRYSEREAKGYSLRHSVYGSANTLLFEDSFAECARTDYIVLGALNIAKSRDEFASATLDSDGDGLRNCIEVQLGLNPQNASDAAADLDGDGLSNLAEFNAGSSPLFADTDGDGLSDAAEVQQHGTDPFAADADGDGISDADEIADPRLDPNLADSDHDGVTDPWELQLQSDPSDPLDATEDFDHDGFSNRQESWASTDPLRLERLPARGAIVMRHDIGGPIDFAPAIGRDGVIHLTDKSQNSSIGYVRTAYPDGVVQRNEPMTATLMGPVTLGPDGAMYYWARLPGTQATDPKSAIYARNPDGTVRWTFSSLTLYFSSPISLGRDGRVVVGARGSSISNGFVLTLDRNGGAVHSTPVSYEVTKAPVVAPDGTTFAVSDTGTVYAYKPDGAALWTFAMRSSAGGALSLGANGVLYTVDNAGYVYALQLNGSLFWEQRYSTAAPRSGITVGDNGVLYHGTAAGQLLALSASTGTPIWPAPPTISTAAILTPAVGRDGTVYAVSAGGRVSAFDPTGTLLWSTIAGSLISAPPVIDRDGTLYIGTLRGQLLALADRSGGPARSAWPMLRHDNAGSSFQCFNSETFSIVNDTDGDHVQDCDELQFGLDPNNAADGALDLDGDGLSNAEEAQLGTRLNHADSDGDGLTDSQEVRVHHTNPLSNDSDGDLLPDGYELQYQFNPLDGSDGVADADNDGFSNRQEMLGGTDPLSMSSAPAAGTVVANVSNSSFPERRPAAAPDGTIYVNGADGIEALAPNLAVKWRWREPVESQVTVGTNRLIYAVTRQASGARRLIALHPDGTLRWSFPLGLATAAYYGFDAPVVANDGSVYVSYRRTITSNIFTYIDGVTAEGRRKISSALSLSALNGNAQQRLSIDGQGRVVYADWSFVQTLNPETLQVVWSQGLTSSGAVTPLSVPIVDSTGAIYVTRASTLFALSASGAISWTRPNVRGQPVMTENGLIVATCASNGQLCAFDRAGTLLWQMQTSHPLLGAPAVDSNNIIHQLTSNGRYLRVNALGQAAGETTIPAVTLFDYPLIMSDGMVYIGAAGVNILALNNAVGSVDSPWPTKNRDATSRRNALAPPVGGVPATPAIYLTSAVPDIMTYGANIVATAGAADFADGDLSGAIEWRSSLDGVFGQGQSVNLRTLHGGNHVITASVTDADGLSATLTFDVRVNYQRPVLSVTSPLSNAHIEIGTAIQFRATSNDPLDGDITAQIRWTSDRDGLLGIGGSFSAVLSPGQHRVDVVSLNSVGLDSNTPLYLTIEHVAPAITILSPQSFINVAPGAQVLFSGTAVDSVDGDLSAQLRWFSALDGPLHVGPTFSTTSLSTGFHSVYAAAVDSHGVSGEQNVGFEVYNPNNDYPWVDFVPSTYNPTNYGQPITFTATAGDAEDGDGLTNIRWLSRRDGFIGTGVQLTISTLSPGQHVIYAVVTDSGGSKASNGRTHTVNGL
jgi:YD repeat-containing protein